MKLRTKPFLLISVAASALTFASSHAASIALTNGSLEAPSYYNPNDQYPGWYGVWYTVPFNGWSVSGPTGASPVAQDGSQGLWSAHGAGWCALSQNSSYTVGSAGETLSAFVWAKSTANGWFNLQLLLDGSQMSYAQPYFASTTDWTQITTSYVTTAVDIGKTVGISFGTDGGSSGQYVYMDSASLTTSVPEPGAALLGGLGMFFLLRRRRS